MVSLVFFFFFYDTAPTELYTLSLHDALPIFRSVDVRGRHSEGGVKPPIRSARRTARSIVVRSSRWAPTICRSEEHTSELQSQSNLVCRLLLEKKKKTIHSKIYQNT